MKHFLFRAALSSVLSMALSAGPAAADVSDQDSSCSSEAGSNISLLLPLGQTFQPSQSQLDAVEFDFGGYGTGTSSVTLNVRESSLAGTIVGSKTVSVSSVFDVEQTVRFQFDSPLAVTIDATYVLELVTSSNTIGIFTACSYGRGTLFLNGNEFPADTSFATFGPCGNGDLDAGEECDDEEFECCDFPSCQFSDTDTACDLDGNECTTDTCNGAGACGAVNTPAETPCTQDSDPCDIEVCNGAGACSDSLDAPEGTACSADANLCTADACDGAGACVATPEPDDTCDTASSAGLVISNSEKAGKDSVKFKWKKGPDNGGLGDPLDTTTYALCIYDDAGDLEAHGNLTPNAGWLRKSSGKLLYKDTEGTIGNVTAAGVSFPGDGQSASMSLGGPGLALSPLVLTRPVTAQIRTSAGACMGAVFTGEEIKKDDGAKLIASEKNEP